MSGAQVRAQAAATIAEVLGGRSLDDALGRTTSDLTPPNRALLQALAYGVLRERRVLEALLQQLLVKPLQDEPVLQALLLCGLQQLRAMRMPAFAAVDETVSAVALIGKPWARKLTNAVLRRYQRESVRLEAALPEDPAIRYSYPAWLVQHLQQDWPERWHELLAAGNEQGPLVLRVNRRRGTTEAYRAELSATGLAAEPVPDLPDALLLVQAVPVDRLPGFAAGRVSVQDGSAQRAASLLGLEDGQRVLDACAAPGGKTAQMLEQHDLELTALDIDVQRLERVQTTLVRLGLTARVVQGDAMHPEAWWDGRPYDRILLDAPCTGTGVIRRHPDIKWLRRPADVAALAHTQHEMLEALWPLLVPGGRLLFCTCSVLAAEGPAVVAKFLENHPEARAEPLDVAWGEPLPVGRRQAPGGAFDGFYYAGITKAMDSR